MTRSINMLLIMKVGEIIKIIKKIKKLLILQKSVEKQSNIYKQQLLECKNSLSTSKYIIF